MNSFIMELEKEFTLSDDMTTDSFTFRIHNPGEVSLSWKFDNDAVGAFSSTSWIDGSPAPVLGSVGAAVAVATPESLTTGTDVIIKAGRLKTIRTSTPPTMKRLLLFLIFHLLLLLLLFPLFLIFLRFLYPLPLLRPPSSSSSSSSLSSRCLYELSPHRVMRAGPISLRMHVVNDPPRAFTMGVSHASSSNLSSSASSQRPSISLRVLVYNDPPTR